MNLWPFAESSSAHVGGEQDRHPHFDAFDGKVTTQTHSSSRESDISGGSVDLKTPFSFLLFSMFLTEVTAMPTPTQFELTF